MPAHNKSKLDINSTEVINTFRAYDVRGIYGKDLNEDIAERVGLAFGTFLGAGNKVGVGRDVRLSSPSLHKALLKGLIASGCNVIDFGLVPTPLLYFGTWFRGLAGGIMITASHLPPEWNGFKLADKTGITLSDGTGLENVKKIFFSGNFNAPAHKGSISEDDIVKDYVEFVSSKITLRSKFRVVFDFGNSVTSIVVPKVSVKLKQDAKFINKELDGTFPNRASEPSEESLQGLKKKVLEEKADIGIGYDCDGDRVAFVDETGRIFASGNITIPLLAAYMLSQNPGKKIVYDITCSSAVGDYIKKIGGEPVIVRVGHSYCAYEVLRQGALFGGQYSGHTAFPEVNCADDAIFGSLKILEALSWSGKKLSELVDMTPSYFTSGVVEIKCDDSIKFKIIEKIKKKSRLTSYKSIYMDGILLYNETGRVLIRASNTAPVIKINSEGKTKEACDSFLAIGQKFVMGEIENG